MVLKYLKFNQEPFYEPSAEWNHAGAKIRFQYCKLTHAA
jgi:hypothetical protein